MKKHIVGLMLSACVVLNAAEVSKEQEEAWNWEASYSALNACGNPIEVYHKAEKVGLIDGKVSFESKHISLVNSEVNGCKYNLKLSVAMTPEDFFQAMNDAGFEKISKNTVSTMPVKSKK